MTWSIGGSTFEELLVTSCRVTKAAGGQDRAVLELALDIDGSAPWEVDEDVQIVVDAAVFFRGVVRRCAPGATGSAEGWVMEAEGQYSTLDEIPLRQPRACVPATSGGPPVMKYDSKCILGWDDDGNRLDTAGIIADIYDYASTQDSGFTYGDVLSGTAITVPQMEVTDVTCGEAVRSVLKWHPDAVVWFDHSAAEVVVSRPGTMATETRASTGDGSGVTSVDVAPRILRKVRGVQIYWRVTSTLDGEEHVDVTPDSAGATSGRRIVTQTIELNGPSTTTQSQAIEVQDIPAAVEDVTEEWLTAKLPELAEAGISLDVVTGNAVVLAISQEVLTDEEMGPGTTLSSYPNELLKGQVQEWMSGISACPVVVTVEVAFKGSREANPVLYDLMHRGGALKTKFQVRMVGTDAITKTYQASATVPGESPVTGLAADYYAALNTDWPEGSVAFVGEDVDIDLHPGKRLTLTGDVPVTLALIQAVEYDIMEGRTRVTFGPAGILQPGDLVELLRAGNRSRPLVNVSGGFRTSSTTGGGTVIKGATGGRQTGATKVRPAKSLGPWEVTQEGEGSVRINAGIVQAPHGITDATTSGLAELTQPSRSWTVLGDVLDVSDGDSVWYKIPLKKVMAYEVEAEGGTSPLVRVTVPVHAYQFEVPEGEEAVAGEFVASPTRPAAATVEFPPTGPGYAYDYAKVASVAIDADGVMTITPALQGPLCLSLTTLVGDVAVEVEGGSGGYWSTTKTGAGEATVSKCMLLSWTSSLYTDLDPEILQTAQDLFRVWDGASFTTESAAPVITGLSDGDYLWVTVPLLDSISTVHTTSENAGGDGGGDPQHQHDVAAIYSTAQGGADTPYIEYGASLPTSGIWFPFARYWDATGVEQLHTGLLSVPYFLTIGSES